MGDKLALTGQIATSMLHCIQNQLIFIAAVNIRTTTEDLTIRMVAETIGSLIITQLSMLDLYSFALSLYIGNMTSIRVLGILFAALGARAIRLCWQLPTYNGTKSYQNLLVGVYGAATGFLIGSHLDTTLHNSAINLIRSGYYHYNSGNVNGRSSSGDYWQLRASLETDAGYLYFYSTGLAPQDTKYKGNGFAVRCLGR